MREVDTFLFDKTGTLTLGRPQITDVVAFNGVAPDRVLALAGAAERYSEHPLAEAVRRKCRADGLVLAEPEAFEALPGFGVRAQVDGAAVVVGNERLVPGIPAGAGLPALRDQGKTLLFVAENEAVIGALAAADTLRSEAPQAIADLRALGIRRIEVLTGDNEQAAAALGAALGVPVAGQLAVSGQASRCEGVPSPQAYRRHGGRRGQRRAGVSQADVGIAIGAAGTAVAAEAAQVVLMRGVDADAAGDPHRTAHLNVIRLNILFTGCITWSG